MTVNVTEERIELTAIDKSTAVVRQVQGAYDGLRTSIDTMRTALFAVGSTIGAGAMLKMFQDTVKAAAALDDMAETTGSTVEQMSRLQVVTRISGQSMDLVTGSAVKLVSGLRGTDEETKKASNALGLLGIKAKDSSGQLRDSGVLMQEVARELARYEDGAAKTAIALDLFGKSGAQLLPYLKDLAAEGEVNARMTSRQAAEAEELEKSMRRLGVAFDDVKRDFMLPMVGVLNDLIEKFKAAQQAAGGFGSGLVTALTAKTGNIPQRLAQIEKELAASDPTSLHSNLAGLFTLGLSSRLDEVGHGKLLAERDYLRALQRQEALKLAGPGSLDARDLMLGGGLQQLNYTPAAEEKKAARETDYQRLLAQSGQMVRALQMEADGVTNLTKAEELRIRIEEAVGAGLMQLTDAEWLEVDALLNVAEHLEKEARARDKAKKAAEEGERARVQSLASLRQEVAGLAEQNRALEQNNAEIGLTTEQQGRLTIARAEETLAIARQNEFLVGLRDSTQEEIDLARKRVELAERFVELTRQGVNRSIDAARNKEAAEELKRTTDNIERALTEAIMRGGKSGLEYLKDAFRTAILTPIISPIVRPVAQAMGGLVQGVTGGLFGGARGGAGAPSYAGGVFGAGGGAGSFGLPGLSPFQPQFFADFSNYFGNIGSITESGSVFGFSDAMAGFVGQYPVIPYLPAIGQLMAGNTTGAALSAGGAFLGNMIVPGIGGVVGGIAGSLVGGALGGGAGDAERTAPFNQAFGLAGLSSWAYQGDRWFSADMLPAQEAFRQQQARAEQNLIERLRLDAGQVGAVNAALAGPNSRIYGFGMEHTDVAQSGAFEQIRAARLQAISGALGRSIDELTRIMSLSAEEWQSAIENIERAVQQGEQALGAWAKNMPAALGITALDDYRRSLAVSEVNAPLDRLSAARGYYDEILARARGGDLDAVRAFPGVAQQLLGIGRDTYASGSGFQELFVEVNRSLQDMIERQQALQADILKDVPATIQEAAQDQIAEIRRQTNALVAGLDAIKLELRRMQAA